jgi:4-phytase/acid phosphatase
MKRLILFFACLLSFAATLAPAQMVAAASTTGDAELKFVVYFSRHGVRSPTGKPAQYNAYSAASWPAWDVPPGNLTAHGYRLMELFGAYDRMQLSNEGLLASNGCSDATSVTFYADSDQRTRETGKALAEGLFPSCNVHVKALPEGVNDPLFHPNPADFGPVDTAMATAAIAGRIGNDPANLTQAYHEQIGAMDKLLATCGAPSSTQQKRTSLFDLPSILAPGLRENPIVRGPQLFRDEASERVEHGRLSRRDNLEVGWSGYRPYGKNTCLARSNSEKSLRR